MWDTSTVRAAGCGGEAVNGSMYLSTGTPVPNVSEFTVYQFTQDYKTTPAFDLPNQPVPIAIWADTDNGKTLTGNNRDAHGMIVTKDKYLHQFDRVRNNVEVFKVNKNLEYEGSYSLKNSSACTSTLNAATQDDPTPDLADVDLKNKRIYVALREQAPLRYCSNTTVL